MYYYKRNLPMEKLRISIAYFTSTGNTLWLCRKAKGIWEDMGHDVALFDVVTESNEFSESISSADISGFFYPVWESSLPHPFRKLVKDMDNGRGSKFILIGCCSKATGDTGLFWKKIIQKKDYNVFYVDHFYLPINSVLPWWNIVKVPKIETQKKLFNTAEKKLKKVCKDVISYKRKCVGRGPHSKLLGSLQRLVFEKWGVLNLWKGMLYVDKNECKKCKLCMRICPVENILINKNGDIKFGPNCILCLKCYNLCPADAVLIGSETKDLKRYTRYKGPESFKPVLYR